MGQKWPKNPQNYVYLRPNETTKRGVSVRARVRRGEMAKREYERKFYINFIPIPPPGAVGSCEESIKRTGGGIWDHTKLCTELHPVLYHHWLHHCTDFSRSNARCRVERSARREGVLYIIHRVSGSPTSNASSQNHRHLHAFPHFFYLSLLLRVLGRR